MKPATLAALLAAALSASCESTPGPGGPGLEVMPLLVPPADDEFVPFRCGGLPATDPMGDEPGGSHHRDIIGDLAEPALFHAMDATFLYLRMRIDGDPTQSADDLAPFGWGYEFDTDGTLTSYEHLALANGIGTDEITWQENTVQALPDDPADPAETIIDTYVPSVDYWHSVQTTSTFGGDPDWFLTLAIPLADLAAAGISTGEPIVVWAGTSNSVHSLNVDFACHDGTTGDPSLSDPGIDVVILDPDVDLDGDGLTNAEEDDLGTDPANPDSDGDGIDDWTETDGGIAVDTDADGTIDALDLDSDDDGAGDAIEGTGDVDGDGTPNWRDPEDGFDPDDIDGDGIPNDDEVAIGTLPGSSDSDGDGIDDATETDGGLAIDTDGDGVIDALDTDSDGDGIPDIEEGTDDSDWDGIPDWRDPTDDRILIATGSAPVVGCAMSPIPAGGATGSPAALAAIAIAAAALLGMRRRP